MEFSKLKLEIYDLLGTLVPGLLALVLIYASLTDWKSLATTFTHTSGTSITVALFFAFAAGQIVQEAGDLLVKATRGPRFFKKGRDEFWNTSEKTLVQEKITASSGLTVDVVDTAYDYCLTRIEGSFPKRDTFLAIADLARSLWLLSIAVLFPALRAVARLPLGWHMFRVAGATLIAVCVTGFLAWSRMIRFRYLSDVTVFRVFLALDVGPKKTSSDSTGADKSED